MKERAKKTLILTARIAVTAAAIAVCAVMLETYDYISRFGAIDNGIGMLPVILIVAALACICVIVWLGKVARRTAICIALAVISGEQ